MYKNSISHIEVKFFYSYKENHIEKYSIHDGRKFGGEDWLHHNKFRKNEDIYSPLFPNAPLEIDEKLLVCHDELSKYKTNNTFVKRHFSHYDEHDGLWCFANGKSSFTNEDSILEHYYFWKSYEYSN